MCASAVALIASQCPTNTGQMSLRVFGLAVLA